MDDTLYRRLGREVSRAPISDSDNPPPPDTVITATIETIDNDRATNLLGGFGS